MKTILITNVPLVILNAFRIALTLFLITEINATPSDDLLDAALKGDLSKVEAALKAGADINTKKMISQTHKSSGHLYIEGSTALILASGEGNLDIVKFLLLNKADINAKDKHGWTSLMKSSDYNHLDIAKILIANNADINTETERGTTALIRASYRGYLELAKLLIENRAEINAKEENGRTPLMWATEMGHLEMAKLLIANNADVNAKALNGSPCYGQTVLMAAQKEGHIEIVKLLIKNNSDVNLKDEWGRTALIAALQYGQTEIAKILIANKADMSDNTLIIASENGQLEIVKLLISNNVNVNANSGYGMTALMSASKSGHLEIVKLLIEKNAEVNAKTENGETALITASKYGHHKIVKLLMDHKLDLNAQDSDGYTAIIWALKCNCSEVISLLISKDSILNFIDTNYQSALLWALREEKWELASMILKQSPSFLIENLNGEKEILHFFKILDSITQSPETFKKIFSEKIKSSPSFLWFFYTYFSQSDQTKTVLDKTNEKIPDQLLFEKRNEIPYSKPIYYLLSRYYSLHKDFTLTNLYYKLACEEHESLRQDSLGNLDLKWFREESNKRKIGFLYKWLQEEKIPQLLLQNGHMGGITEITYSPDGKTFATSSSDKTVKIWSRKGQLLHELKGHIGYVISIRYSPDGKTLVTLGIDKIARIWNNKGQLLYEIEDDITYIGFSPNGKSLVTTSKGNQIRIWSITAELLREHPLQDDNSSLIYSPDNRTYITISKEDKTIKIWDIKGQLLTEIKKYTTSFLKYLGSPRITYSPDGRTIVVSSDDNKVRIWDITTGKLLNEFNANVYELVYSPDGKTFATTPSGGSSAVKIWSSKGQLLHELTGKGSVENITFSPNGKKLTILSSDEKARIWSNKGQLLNEFNVRANYLVYSPDGKSFLTDSFYNNRIKSWNEDGKLQFEIKSYVSEVFSVGFSQNSKSIAIGSSNMVRIWSIDGKCLLVSEGSSVLLAAPGEEGFALARTPNKKTVKIWNNTNKLLQELKHQEEVTNLAYSPDGKSIAIGLRDGTTKLWDNEGKLLLDFKGSGRYIGNIVFRPDGKTLVTSTRDHILRIWNSNDGKLLHEFKGHEDDIYNLIYSPDGKTFATSSKDKTVKIWSSEDKLLHELNGDSYKIIYSPDGKNILTTSENNTVKIWSEEGKLLRELNGHTAPVNSLAYSLDGTFIFSGSKDNSIRIWSNTGNPITKLKGHSNAITSLKFIKEGKILVSTSWDNTIKFWNIEKALKDEPALLATQIFFTDKSSLFFTPDNYYMVTDQSALRAVSFKKENKIYDFDQFDLKFNRPDIILDRLRSLFLHKQEKNETDDAYKDRVKDYENKITLYKNYYEHRIKQNGFKPEQLSGENKIHAPEISAVKVNNQDVESKDFDSKTKDKKVKLSFTIEDEKDSNLDIVGYKVFVQGVPLHGQYIKMFPSPAKRKIVEEEITLSTFADIGDPLGSNTIEISGYTSDGIESSKQKIYLTYENQALNKKGNLYLVTLGTEKYESGKKSDLSDLNYSIDDATDLQKLFKEKNDKDKIYKSIVPILLKDEEINRAGANKIRSVLSKSEVDDTVIFFLSGHGVRADTPISTAEAIASELGITQSIGEPSNNKDHLNVYYYMTSHSSTKEPWKNGIPMEAFRFALDGIRARQKILLIDTCQSGEKIELTGYKPSKQRIEEVKKLRDSFKNTEIEKGIRRLRGNENEESLSNREKFYITMAYEWELRELSKIFPELRRGTGTIEISAASGTQSALESGDWKNGAFTFTIKEAILGGKAKEGSDITAKSLRKYILDRVEKLTEGRQIPMVTRDISGRDFRITK